MEIVDINDGSLGRVRMAVLATAILVREATGLEIILHFTCRDRNLMGLQADLLGAHALGIRNILAMTGDPAALGRLPQRHGRLRHRLRIGLMDRAAADERGAGRCRQRHRRADRLRDRRGADPGATISTREVERVKRKIAAGARWIRPSRSTTWSCWNGSWPGRRLAGAGPDRDPAAPELPARRVPAQRGAGHHHSRSRRARLKAAGEGALRAGIEMAQRLAEDVRARDAGAYLMPSFGRFEVVAEVLDALH